jgi:hypothetical protein
MTGAGGVREGREKDPLIARTIIKHDLGVGLNEPIRLMTYEHAVSGTVRLACDFPLVARKPSRHQKRRWGDKQTQRPRRTCGRRRSLERTLRLTNG